MTADQPKTIFALFWAGLAQAARSVSVPESVAVVVTVGIAIPIMHSTFACEFPFAAYLLFTPLAGTMGRTYVAALVNLGFTPVIVAVMGGRGHRK